MLFTDGDIVTSANLSQIDSEVLSVASTSKPAIQLDGPGSLCAQAWQECGGKIASAMQMYTSYLASPGMSGGGVAAIYNVGTAARNQVRARLNQVVATESQYGQTSSMLQLWLSYTALRLFFRDASARMGKDRLETKYERYSADADYAWRQLRQNGLPYIASPMEAPGAKHGANAGSWSIANLSTVAGTGTAPTVGVAITYYDASKYVSEANTMNAESGPSDILQIAIPAASVLQVSIAGLNPPNGTMDQVGLSQGAWTPLNATHWILWVGLAGSPLYWQAAIPIATKTYTLAGDPVATGNILGLGQWPDLNLTFQATVGRG